MKPLVNFFLGSRKKIDPADTMVILPQQVIDTIQIEDKVYKKVKCRIVNSIAFDQEKWLTYFTQRIEEYEHQIEVLSTCLQSVNKKNHDVLHLYKNTYTDFLKKQHNYLKLITRYQNEKAAIESELIKKNNEISELKKNLKITTKKKEKKELVKKSTLEVDVKTSPVNKFLVKDLLFKEKVIAQNEKLIETLLEKIKLQEIFLKSKEK